MTLNITVNEGEELPPQIAEQINQLYNGGIHFWTELNKFDFAGCFVKSIETDPISSQSKLELCFDAILPEKE